MADYYVACCEILPEVKRIATPKLLRTSINHSVPGPLSEIDGNERVDRQALWAIDEVGIVPLLKPPSNVVSLFIAGVSGVSPFLILAPVAAAVLPTRRCYSRTVRPNTQHCSWTSFTSS